MGHHPGPPAILVGVDGRSREGREARFSILFNRRILAEAAAIGIAEYESSSGESVYAFRPQLFATFVEITRSGVEIPLSELSQAAKASGFLDEATPDSAERARIGTAD